MRDHYNPKDLNFEKIKKIYEKDLLGPSLRHMTETRKIAI